MTSVNTLNAEASNHIYTKVNDTQVDKVVVPHDLRSVYATKSILVKSDANRTTPSPSLTHPHTPNIRRLFNYPCGGVTIWQSVTPQPNHHLAVPQCECSFSRVNELYSACSSTSVDCRLRVLRISTNQPENSTTLTNRRNEGLLCLLSAERESATVRETNLGYYLLFDFYMSTL